MAAVGIRIVGLVNGGSTPFDGLWLREYDPDRRGRDPAGQPMLAWIKCTRDPAKAMRFERRADALEVWRRASRRWPHEGRLVPDGKLNRPLTAFNVEIGPLPTRGD